jgi:alpha-beta hydrolase superfamily lysophospholipase
MFAGARRLADPAQVARIPRDLPLYVAVGSRDPVNAGLTLLWALVDRYRTAGLDDVTVRVYDDGRHEILNEINRAEVIDDLLQWLRRVSAHPAGSDPRRVRATPAAAQDMSTTARTNR